MTEMYDPNILEIFQVAVGAAVAASTMPALPVKYVAIGFDPKDDAPDGKYLEVVFIPNNTNDYWGNERNYAGLLRLILHWPNNGEGPTAPLAVLASVCSYFTKDRLLQNVQISDNPNLTGVLEESGAENLFPASIRYQCFRT